MSDHLTRLMLRLKKEMGLTSVVVTHDLDLLHRVADRVVFLSKGQYCVLRPAGRNVQVARSRYSGFSGTRQGDPGNGDVRR